MGEYYEKKKRTTARKVAQGLLHLCYGPGPGKTSRAVGLSTRAVGSGLKVVYIQFLLSEDSSEAKAFDLLPHLQYISSGFQPGSKTSDQKKGRELAKQTLEFAREAIERRPQVLICEEILTALADNYLEVKEVLELAAACRGQVELFMTGRTAPEVLVEVADYVTELVER